jgi:hypothetical protein
VQRAVETDALEDLRENALDDLRDDVADQQDQQEADQPRYEREEVVQPLLDRVADLHGGEEVQSGCLLRR